MLDGSHHIVCVMAKAVIAQVEPVAPSLSGESVSTLPVGQIVGAILVIALLASVSTFVWFLRSAVLSRTVESSLFDSPEDESDDEGEEDSRTLVSQWLFTAGFRSPQAEVTFWILTFLGATLGGLVVLAAFQLDLLLFLRQQVESIPGNVGKLLIPLIVCAPLIMIATPACIPLLVVRARRRTIVQQVEEDFPLFLDLLATLTEGGYAFDQAVFRITELQPGQRAFPREVRTFQSDLLSGRRRVDALRRLSDRLDIDPVTNFTSAVIQADQTGAGLATTIRLQADDFRVLRRENAFAKAQAVAVKLIVPLVLLFSPALFVATLGPTVYRILAKLGQFAEDFLPPTTGG